MQHYYTDRDSDFHLMDLDSLGATFIAHALLFFFLFHLTERASQLLNDKEEMQTIEFEQLYPQQLNIVMLAEFCEIQGGVVRHVNGTVRETHGQNSTGRQGGEEKKPMYTATSRYNSIKSLPDDWRQAVESFVGTRLFSSHFAMIPNVARDLTHSYQTASMYIDNVEGPLSGPNRIPDQPNALAACVCSASLPDYRARGYVRTVNIAFLSSEKENLAYLLPYLTRELMTCAEMLCVAMDSKFKKEMPAAYQAVKWACQVAQSEEMEKEAEELGITNRFRQELPQEEKTLQNRVEILNNGPTLQNSFTHGRGMAAITLRQVQDAQKPSVEETKRIIGELILKRGTEELRNLDIMCGKAYSECIALLDKIGEVYATESEPRMTDISSLMWVWQQVAGSQPPLLASHLTDMETLPTAGEPGLRKVGMPLTTRRDIFNKDNSFWTVQDGLERKDADCNYHDDVECHLVPAKLELGKTDFLPYARRAPVSLLLPGSESDPKYYGKVAELAYRVLLGKPIVVRNLNVDSEDGDYHRNNFIDFVKGLSLNYPTDQFSNVVFKQDVHWVDLMEYRVIFLSRGRILVPKGYYNEFDYAKGEFLDLKPEERYIKDKDKMKPQNLLPPPLKEGLLRRVSSFPMDCIVQHYAAWALLCLDAVEDFEETHNIQVTVFTKNDAKEELQVTPEVNEIFDKDLDVVVAMVNRMMAVKKSNSTKLKRLLQGGGIGDSSRRPLSNTNSAPPSLADTMSVTHNERQNSSPNFNSSRTS